MIWINISCLVSTISAQSFYSSRTVMRRHSAHTFRLFLIRMRISICRQLYRNNASTLRKLERCQQQFGRLSWSWTVPSSFIWVWVWIWLLCPTFFVWKTSNSFKCWSWASPYPLISLLLIPTCFKGESDTGVKQELLSSQLWVIIGQPGGLISNTEKVFF